jgi:hypothetical protein
MASFRVIILFDLKIEPRYDVRGQTAGQTYYKP